MLEANARNGASGSVGQMLVVRRCAQRHARRAAHSVNAANAAARAVVVRVMQRGAELIKLHAHRRLKGSQPRRVVGGNRLDPA